MSKSPDFTLQQAAQIAENYRMQLAPYCTRIEIAGSVRREKSIVHDIELVAVPLICDVRDMFGTFISSQSALEVALPHLLTLWGASAIKNGPKYKQFGLAENIKLDLFLVTPPAEWGVIFALRTGSADFSHRLVTSRKYGGFLPSYAKVRDGQVIDSNGDSIPMPEEGDFLEFCGLPRDLPPKSRE